MNYFLRPYRCITLCLVPVAAGALLTISAQAGAQARITPLVVDSNTQAATAERGYLGIDIADVDAQKIQVLHVKDAHGAVITMIDHDAPAGQAGLRVNDVVLQLNGQAIENADHLRRMLKEMPAGRKVALEFSRDGNVQTLTVELADRKLMEKSVWSKLGTDNNAPKMGILSGDTMPSGFHLPSFGSTLKVGALVEPLTAQMAAYLGVDSGLMVKEVAHKSDAEAAGLHAFDIILKVGTDSIATSADWDRALRANQGKPVAVTILRDKKQQTLTLQVDSKHHQGKCEEPLTAEQKHELAQLENNLKELQPSIDANLAEQIASEAEAISAQAEMQAEDLRDRLEDMHFGMSPEEAEQLRHNTDKLRESLKALQVDPKQMQDLRRQMEEFRKNFHPEQFRIDPKQMKEFEQQVDEFRRDMENFHLSPQGHFV